MVPAIVMVGCAVSDPAGTEVDARVRVLPEDVALVVTADAVELPRAAVPDLAAGDIIVSAHGEGLLRAVDAIEARGDTLVLRTHDAELGDAVIAAELAASFGNGKADTHQLPGIHVAIADKVLYDSAAMTATLVKGSLAFEPALDLDLAIEDRALQTFEMVLRGRISGELDLDITARDVAAGPEIVLWESPPAVFYQQIGFVPVVEAVSTSVVLKLQAAARGSGRVRIDASAIATLAAGLRYTAGDGWDGVAELAADAHGAVPFTAPTLDQVGVRAWLAARADVRFYGVAGPYIAAGPQLEVTRTSSTGALDAKAGFRGGVGGGLKLFRLNLPALPTFDVFDWMTPLD